MALKALKLNLKNPLQMQILKKTLEWVFQELSLNLILRRLTKMQKRVECQ